MSAAGEAGHLSHRAVGDVVVVTLSGKLLGDASGESLRECLVPLLRAGKSLVLDLSTCEWLSEQAERALMIGAKEARSANVKIVAAAPTPPIRESFAINRFDRVLRLYDTVDEALAALDN